MSSSKRKRSVSSSERSTNPFKRAIDSVRGRAKQKSRRVESDGDDGNDGNDGTSSQHTNNAATDNASDTIDLTGSGDEDLAESRNAKIKALREQVTKRKSNAYAFFNREPEIEFANKTSDEVKYVVFHCTICRAALKQGKGKDAASTGALLRHARQCWGEETVTEVMKLDDNTDTQELRDELKTTTKKGKGEQSRLTALFKPVKKTWDKIWSTLTPSKERIRVATARMCAEEARPFNIVQGRCYRWLQREGRPDRYIPPRQQVSKDVKKLFEKCKRRLAAELQEYDGEFAVALDCWTSPNHRACMSIKISRMRKNENGEEVHVTHLLDFVELPCSHSGANMAECLFAVLKEYGIEDRILSITIDNASANDTMIDELEKLIANFLGRRSHVRCMAHTVNLTAKGILRPFEPRKKKRSTNDEEAGDNNEEDTIRMDELRAEIMDIAENGVQDGDDVEGFVDVFEEMGEVEKEEWLEAVLPLRTALIKTRRISFRTINSTTLLLPAWRLVTSGTVFKDRTLPRDVATRWNSTFDMLFAFLEMREQVDQFTNTYSNGLTDYILADDEWDAIADLVSILKVLKDATEYFSSDGVTISSVIPAMDMIDEQLATGILNTDSNEPTQLSAPLRHALTLGKRTINKYYELSDSSDIYRLSMVLHPAYKTTYFTRLGWDEAWVEEALRITRDAWKRYKPATTRDVSSVPQVSGSVASSSTIPRTNSFAKLIQNQVNLAVPDLTIDELERYLKDSTVPTDKPLEWWIANRKLYPNLSKLAISVHCVMPSTVAVERSFSRGRILISHLRNRLRSNTVRALMCFGEWSRLDMFSPTELEDMLKEEDEDGSGDDLIDDELIMALV